MWIKYKSGKRKDETVDMDDAAAKLLIDDDIAEKTEAPATVKSLDVELKGLIADTVKSTASEVATEIVTELRKSLPRQSAGFINLPDNAEIKLPSTVKRYGSLKNFPNTEEGRLRAYRFGMYCLGTYALDPSNREGKCHSAIATCKSLGINLSRIPLADVETKTSRDNNNTSSAYLVPDEFDNDLIDLREKFGVFRKYAKIRPMASDTRSDPRRKGGLTAVFVGESIAAAQSDKTWDRVRMTAKKLMVLTKYSNELNEDAVLNIGDDLAGEIAYAFANKEDLCGFNGDGTSTYGGIVGVRQSLLNVDATVANVLGLRVASGTGYGTNYNSIVLADFNAVVGLLPEYADTDNCKWFVHRSFWANVMQKLATAGGGNRVDDIESGARRKMFLGYEVVTSQVMPKTSAINQVPALLGDLSLAASFGDRRQTAIAISEHALNAFEQDELAIRGTERFDINIHDVGESSANTARDPVMGLSAGPVVGLVTAAS